MLISRIEIYQGTVYADIDEDRAKVGVEWTGIMFRSMVYHITNPTDVLKRTIQERKSEHTQLAEDYQVRFMEEGLQYYADCKTIDDAMGRPVFAGTDEMVQELPALLEKLGEYPLEISKEDRELVDSSLPKGLSQWYILSLLPATLRMQFTQGL